MIEIVGPFVEEYRVALDGYHVPHIAARPIGVDSVDVSVDHRFCLPEPVTREEFERWLPLLANAMAVAAGYSCHGESCQPVNPFKVRMARLGQGPSKPTLKAIEGGLPSPPKEKGE